jgi:hypothetical protein
MDQAISQMMARALRRKKQFMPLKRTTPPPAAAPMGPSYGTSPTVVSPDAMTGQAPTTSLEQLTAGGGTNEISQAILQQLWENGTLMPGTMTPTQQGQ